MLTETRDFKCAYLESNLPSVYLLSAGLADEVTAAVRQYRQNPDPDSGFAIDEVWQKFKALDGLKTKGESPQTGNATPPSELTPTGFLGGEELAEALGVDPTRRKAFSQRLMRQRMSLEDECWYEVSNPRPNRPRFLYRVDSPKLRELAAGYETPKPA